MSKDSKHLKEGQARTQLSKVGLGGSCHWCTEAIFASLKGMKSVSQGWLSAPQPNDKFSEGVLLEFQSEAIALKDLVAIHVHTHSATAKHFLRDKYRSAVYVFNEQDKLDAEQALKKLQKDFDKPLITQVLSYSDFKNNTENFQDYYYKDPQRPFCQAYINPKLQKLLDNYAHHLDADKVPIIKAAIK